MRVRITPGGHLEGRVRVPGDKSIAHRWLILAATARGPSALVEVPASLDVRSTAACPGGGQSQGSTCTPSVVFERCRRRKGSRFHVERQGWRTGRNRHLRSRVRGARDSSSLRTTSTAGTPGPRCVCSPDSWPASPFRTVLTGDDSLRSRPMERVAAPLRAMGAAVETDRRPCTGRHRGGRPAGHRPSHPGADRPGEERGAAGRPRRRRRHLGHRTGRHPRPHRASDRARSAARSRSRVRPCALSASSTRASRGPCRAIRHRPPSWWPPPRSRVSELTIDGVGLNPSRTHYPRGDGADGCPHGDPRRSRGGRRTRRRAVGGPVRRDPRDAGRGRGSSRS